MAIRSRLFTAVLLLAVTIPAPAFADSATTPAATAPLEGAAKAAFDTGKVLFRDGDFPGALVKFRFAYDQSKDARLLWNMAVCEKNARHYANVLRLTEQYLREGGSQLSEEDRQSATQLLNALRPLVSSLRITVDKPGATIFVDDQEVGTSPVAEPILVDLGTRRVRVTKQGFKETQITANVTGGAGGGEELRIQIEKDKASEQGHLNVTAGINDTIELDGRRVGLEHFTGAVAAGMHSLRVTGPDEKPSQQEVLVRDGETRTVQVTLEKQAKNTWLWVTGGVIAAAGAGVIIAAAAGAFSGGSDTTTRTPPPSGNFSPGLVQLP